ncbi:four-carbon acid sugar kinase family protein [Candidimonas sp. SYP-B2681]|uniref:3-oxo-tetronate kinase n=1 Tax=Candidimonas sp. SYP-B2681 TaxID=2497686 RepID=UPI000F875256|nr:3-oxo-tetronate kinase [Candidimonas sp. SYP-B2681]RTZ47839.1 four-carbon acid sugar kinase family protein [Candidimonas sp. SYP-B2681]
MAALLGCIADDFTGATDLAGMLQQAGMRTIQIIGVPTSPLSAGLDADAIVIALKTRTAPVQQAIDDSKASLKWLQAAGCRQMYFKYCSTFDSTAEGNIGPVTDALMETIGTDFTIACPAFPENQRTVYKGHLFVGNALLAESGMRDHPLTPMTDSNLVRVLQAQTRGLVGLIEHSIVAAGTEAIRREIRRLRGQGVKTAIVDAICNADLIQIGAACSDLPMVTAGSGLAIGIPQNFIGQGSLSPMNPAVDPTPATSGLRAILSGSCSQASQAQLNDLLSRGIPGFALDPLVLASSDTALESVVNEVMAWVAPRLESGPVVIYATAAVDKVKQIQSVLGAERAGAVVETALAAIAGRLIELGVRQLIVAGGETSGAVVTALNIDRLQIHRQIDPGVPWTVSLNKPSVALALKSGNFGSVDFFTKAWDSAP